MKSQSLTGHGVEANGRWWRRRRGSGANHVRVRLRRRFVRRRSEYVFHRVVNHSVRVVQVKRSLLLLRRRRR